MWSQNQGPYCRVSLVKGPVESNAIEDHSSPCDSFVHAIASVIAGKMDRDAMAARLRGHRPVYATANASHATGTATVPRYEALDQKTFVWKSPPHMESASD